MNDTDIETIARIELINPRKRGLANIDIEFVRPITISEITITTAACGKNRAQSIFSLSLENNCDIYEYTGMELIPYVHDELGSGENWDVAVYRDQHI